MSELPSPCSTPALPSALDRFDRIRLAIGNRRPAVFLDYDGTLTPIVERPELALLGDAMRDTLRRLAARSTVAVLSGRDLADVRRLVALDELHYSGSHGFQIQDPSGAVLDEPRASAFLADLDAAERGLATRLAAVDGALLERKRFSIAVHYRLASPDGARLARDAVASVLAAHPRLRRTHGKKVFELRPGLDWDKGKALLWMLQVWGFPPGRAGVVFIGDDSTDEDAFRAISGWGIPIVVRDKPRETAAAYALESPDEVGRFLRALAASLPPVQH